MNDLSCAAKVKLPARHDRRSDRHAQRLRELASQSLSKPSCGRSSALTGTLRALAAALLLLGSSERARALPPQWFMQVGGLSYHFQQTQALGREWQNQHPGLGFERRSNVAGDDPSDWRISATGGVMQDSRGYWGGYAGLAYLRQWRLSGEAEFGTGLGAYGLYRSVSWGGRRALVPAVMPVTTIGLADTGINLNLAYLPRIAVNGHAMPAVLHLKLGFRLP